MDDTQEKSLFRIGEVSRLTATKAFVLRYWETEFPMLQPVKSPSGHRLYRREDIETVFEIKRLLYEEGFTIAGARKHFEERGHEPGGDASSSARSRWQWRRRTLRRARSCFGIAPRSSHAATAQIPARFTRRTARRLDPSRTRVIRYKRCKRSGRSAAW